MFIQECMTRLITLQATKALIVFAKKMCFVEAYILYLMETSYLGIYLE